MRTTNKSSDKGAWTIQKARKDFDSSVLPYVNTAFVFKTSTRGPITPGASPCNNITWPEPKSSREVSNSKPNVKRRRAPRQPKSDEKGRVKARDIDRYFISRWSSVGVVPTTNLTPDLPSTAIWGRWGDQERKLGVQDMHGCTALVVLSRKGYFLSHFYEHPSFRGRKNEVVTEKDQDQIFARQVLEPLVYDLKNPENGRTVATPLREMKNNTLPDGGAGPIFSNTDKIQALIFTPTRRNDQPKEESICYPKYIQQLRCLVEAILPSASINVIDYFRPYRWRDAPPLPAYRTTEQQRDFEDFMQRTATGKALVEYNPASGRLLKGYTVWGPRQYKSKPVATDRWFWP